MRITNNIIQREALSQMQSNLREIAAAQRRVTSGLRLQVASDDPMAASSVMHMRGSLRALEQYRRNIDVAGMRASSEETALDQVGEALTRAKQLGISQLSGISNAASRAATKAEVDEILKFAVHLGNTRLGDEYLFGGRDSGHPPFDVDQPDFLRRDANGQPVVPQGEKEAEIASGQYLRANHDGKQVFLDTGVLRALKDLSEALGSPDAEAQIANVLPSLDAAFGRVQVLVGEVGARSNQLQISQANLDALEINLRTLKSNLEEVDLEKAVTELVSRQTSFQAAMLATSRVMGLTLADYLR